MAQHDYNIANQTGANFRTDLNNALSAISSNNSGSSEPSTMYAYEWWIDTSSNVLKLRNSSNNAWITMPFSITADNTIDINAGTVNGITSFSFSSGSTVTSILDEDNLASDSATALATQQSIKAYVDSQVTAQDLDITDGSFTIAIDLDSETLSLLGGTGVTSAASGNGVTFSIGQSVGTSDNVVFNQVTGALVGNASTATALATARTISGVSFDGTSNITLDTDNIGEGSSNLYYTNARFDTRLATKTTDNLTEGSSNKYFTNERVDDQVNTLLTAGANISLTYDDTAGTLTIANTNSADITSVVAGDGLTGGGTAGDVTLAVGVDDSSIEINSDALRVKASGITNAMLAGSIANAKLANSSITVNSQAISLGGSHTFDTDDIGEGSSNLYYTDARANSAIDARVTNTFINNLSGVVADTATALATGRTIGLSGDVTASGVSFDGTGNITLSTTIAANSIALGTDTTGNYVATIAGTTNEIDVSGSGSETATVTIGLPNDVTIAGNLTVNGTTTTVNSDTLAVTDPLIKLAKSNSGADSLDIGFYGLYDTSGSQDLYAGLFRDANDSGKFKLFKDLQVEPTTTVNTSGTGYAVGTLVSNLEGNVTGNVTGTVSSISNHSTSDLSEGTNLYYTDARFDTRLGTKTTDNLTEGSSNLYMTTERVQDIVGGMVTGNTETGITVTYEDSDGTLDFVVGTLNQDTTGNAATATALATGRTIGMTGDVVWTSASFDGSGNVTGTATIQANSVALGTDTTGDYVSTITGGTGITSTGATSGEGIAHSLSVDAAQTQITSVGALDGGSITSGFGSIDVGSSAITTSGTVTGGTLAGTLSTAAQPNITSVGTLTTLDVTSSASDAVFLRSSQSTTTNVYITNTNATANNTANLYFAPANNVSGALISTIAIEDFSSSANRTADLAFSTRKDGTMAERMRIDSSGNLLISSTTDYEGRVQIAASNQAGLFVRDSSASNAAPYLRVQGQRSDGNGSESFSGGLVLEGYATGAKVADAKALGTIYFGGNHTDGTESNISYAASIVGKAEGAFNSATDMPTGLAFFTGDAGTALKTANSDFGTERMRIDSSGNVGLGTASPNFKFHLKDGTSTAVYQQFSNDTTGNASSDGTVLGIDADGDFLINNQESKTIKFSTADTERMRIDSSGKVKIGNTGGSGILNVDNGSNDGGYVHFANNVGGTTLTNDKGLAFGWNKSSGGGESVIIANQGAGSTGGLVFATNTSGGSYAERMRIDTSGNVGIGVTSPDNYNSSAENLVVGSSGDTGISIVAGTSNDSTLMFADGTGGTAGYRGRVSYDHASDYMRFDTAAAERMRIDGSGNVTHTFSGGETLAISRDGAGTFVGNTSNHNLRFITNDAERMRIDSSGNVGIGITDPDQALEIGAGGKLKLSRADNARSLLLFNDNSNSTIQSDTDPLLLQSANIMTFNTNGANERMRITTDGQVLATPLGVTVPSFSFIGDSNTGMTRPTGDTLQFVTGGSERMRIDSSGQLFLGKTSGVSGAFFQVAGDASNQSIRMENAYGTGTAQLITNTSGQTFNAILFENSGVSGSISVTTSATAYNTSSDARLKNVLGEAKGLEIINKLNPVNFEWKESKEIQDGLIAQEVLDVVPNAVSGSEEEMYQMDYSKLVTPLVKAIQEQQTQIDALQSEINKLKGE